MITAPVPAPGRSQWAAEVTVAPSLAAGLIRGQFPGLGAARADLLETGWDNTAFLVDGRRLFRFPRREIALPGIRREMAVLPRLAAGRTCWRPTAGRPAGRPRELAARVCALSMVAALAEYAAADARPALLAEATAGLRRVTA